MLHEPEILISDDIGVLAQIAEAQTLVACWDASQDKEFMELFRYIRDFNQSADDTSFLNPVEAVYMPEIHQIFDGMKRPFSGGYDPLHLWIGEGGDDMSAEATPHTDYPCVGIFFYFNEEDLSTICIPNEYAGECDGEDLNGGHLYPHADFSKAVILPSQSVALIKLNEQVHCSPSEIPSGASRIVMHARYDY